MHSLVFEEVSGRAFYNYLGKIQGAAFILLVFGEQVGIIGENEQLENRRKVRRSEG